MGGGTPQASTAPVCPHTPPDHRPSRRRSRAHPINPASPPQFIPPPFQESPAKQRIWRMCASADQIEPDRRIRQNRPFCRRPLPGGRLGGGWNAASRHYRPCTPRSPTPRPDHPPHAPITHPTPRSPTPRPLRHTHSPSATPTPPPSHPLPLHHTHSPSITPTPPPPHPRPIRHTCAPPSVTPAPPFRHSCAGRNHHFPQLLLRLHQNRSAEPCPFPAPSPPSTPTSPTLTKT